jgi:5-methylcytosine-specific restriction protein A
VIARDRHLCRACGRIGATEVDHIVPVARGGGWELANLQLLCGFCHQIKTRLDRGF